VSDSTLAYLHREIEAVMHGRTLPDLYRDRVLSGRTRQFVIFPKPSRLAPEAVEIVHTLLGIELKAQRRRIACPDLATARYLRVFARLSLGAVAIPYDISQLPRIADDLESSWQYLLLLIENRLAERATRTRLLFRNRVLEEIRRDIERLGPGDKTPTFPQNTRQRLFKP
jgi:hypothetical protein